MQAPPIFLFTDFGAADVYLGQVKAVLHEAAPASRVIDLLNEAPDFRVDAGAHLLAALARRLPTRAITIAVVDPGVGSTRGAVVLQADERWFIGPDNGLLSVVAARAKVVRLYALDAPPAAASVSFHGRDVFAPFAARLATSSDGFRKLTLRDRLEVELEAGDLAQVVYIDHYGNVMTGLRAECAQEQQALGIKDRIVPHARVFSAVMRGSLFWCVNSIGLIEIAANQASAADMLDVAIGDAVRLR